MKLTANAGELAAALSLVELALDVRIVIAILGGVHIKAGADGVVHLVVNALDRVIAVTVTAEVAKPGEAVVRASALAGLIRGFAKDSTVEISADAHGAWIRCGRARYQLPACRSSSCRRCRRSMTRRGRSSSTARSCWR